MKQKGFVQVLMLVVAIVGLVAGLYLVGKATNILPQAKEEEKPVSFVGQTAQVENKMPPIQNKQDLENTLNDLENTNVDDLNQQVIDNELDGSQI